MGGDTILGTYNRIVGVKFKDNAAAEGFASQAHNIELWHDYLPPDAEVVRSDSLVMIKWPDGMVPEHAIEPDLFPVTVVAAGAGPTAVSGTLTFAGGPSNADGTVTVTFAVDGATDVVVPISFNSGDTAAEVATAVKTLVGAEVSVTTARDLLVVTVSPASGTNLTKLTATIA